MVALALTLPAHSAELPGDGAALSPQQVTAPPNILVIVTDDQRSGMGVMPRTRRILARNGSRFENAVTTTPLCCPSRASIFSGRYAHNTGVHTEADADKLDQGTTMQYYLHEAGYATALFGKYLNSWSILDAPPNFDEWAFFTKSHSYRGQDWNVGGTVRPVRAYSTRYISTRASGFIKDQNAAAPDQPWFMYLATTAPHRPFTAERRFRHAGVGRFHRDPAMRERKRSDKPPYVRVQHASPRAGPRLRTHQLRTLMSVDRMVKAVTDSVADAGELDNTLIFYLSDNGFLWGEHGLTRKAAPYTPSVGIPMLMRPPGGTPALQDQRLVANIDIAPTALQAAGIVTTDTAMDGRSLLGDNARDRILMEYYDEPSEPRQRFQAPTWASLRTSSYQYIEYYAQNGSTVTFREYYDLDNDPYQLHTLLADDNSSNDPDPVTLLLLSQQLAHDRTCSGTSGPSACP